MTLDVFLVWYAIFYTTMFGGLVMGLVHLDAGRLRWICSLVIACAGLIFYLMVGFEIANNAPLYLCPCPSG